MGIRFVNYVDNLILVVINFRSTRRKSRAH